MIRSFLEGEKISQKMSRAGLFGATTICAYLAAAQGFVISI